MSTQSVLSRGNPLSMGLEECARKYEEPRSLTSLGIHSVLSWAPCTVEGHICVYTIWYLAIDEGCILAYKKPELGAICVCVSTCVKATKFFVYVCVSEL